MFSQSVIFQTLTHTSLVVGAKHYIVGMTFSQELTEKLTDLGYHIVTNPYQEFVKSGGSIRCSVLDIGI